jgi:hypothetical protein
MPLYEAATTPITNSMLATTHSRNVPRLIFIEAPKIEIVAVPLKLHKGFCDDCGTPKH